MACKSKRCRVKRKERKMSLTRTNTLALVAKHSPEQLPKYVAAVRAAGKRPVTIPMTEMLAAGTVAADGSLTIPAKVIAKWQEPAPYFGMWG
jgi:hypothetical protein